MYKFAGILLFIWSNLALALNGLRPIGVSAESNAMGGTGVSSFYNYYDALYKNPALMAHAPGETGQTQAVFGMTYGSFTPRVRATYGKDMEYKKPINGTSAAFPSSIGIGRRLTDNISMAFGVYGGGGGADYGEADVVYRAKSRTMSFSAIAGLSLALTPETSIGINGSISTVDTRASNLSVTKNVEIEFGGAGRTYGTLIGISHRISNSIGHVVLGLIYQPQQTVFLPDARDIDEDGIKDNLLFSAVPMEAASGITWYTGNFTMALDYRFLRWSKAEFLKSVGWKDQQVIALGVEYGNKHRLRLGTNQSTSAVSNKSATEGYSTTLVSDKPMLNLAGDAFATTSGLGVTNSHYTVGSSHHIGESMKINTAFVYMVPGYLTRNGQYPVVGGEKIYGWKSKFYGSTLAVDLTYLW